MCYNKFIDNSVNIDDTKAFEGLELTNGKDGIIGDDALIGKKVFYITELSIQKYKLDREKIKKKYIVEKFETSNGGAKK